MKHLAFWAVLIAFTTFIIGCLKDEQDRQIIEQNIEPTLYFYNTDFEEMSKEQRNGYYPFHSPISLVDIDIFTPATLFVHNINKVDSVLYTRISSDRNKYLGIIFNPFTVKYYFNDSTSITYERLVPDYIKDHEVRVPDISYNQLNIANPEKYFIIQKMQKYDKPYHVWCGKNIYRFYYAVVSSSGFYVVEQYEAHMCSGALPYQLIF